MRGQHRLVTLVSVFIRMLDHLKEPLIEAPALLRGVENTLAQESKALHEGER
jgi:hypothetical protein